MAGEVTLSERTRTRSLKRYRCLITAHKRSLRKLCFYICLSVILFTGGWYPSMHGRFLSTGGWYFSMHCRSPGPYPLGKLRGLAWGRGVSRPTPGGKLRGLAWGGLQAHTQRGFQAHTWGSFQPTPGGSPGPHLGGWWISQHALRQAPPTPSHQTATAAGSTHPTRMHSCSFLKISSYDYRYFSPVFIYFILNVEKSSNEFDYRSGTVNSNTVNSKFHLIRSYCEYLARILSFHV